MIKYEYIPIVEECFPENADNINDFDPIVFKAWIETMANKNNKKFIQLMPPFRFMGWALFEILDSN